METHDDRPMRQSDHDLLVTIHTKVERVITDVQELSTNVTGRIQSLEDGKADRVEINEIRVDIRWLQRLAYGGLGILAAIEFYLNTLKK